MLKSPPESGQEPVVGRVKTCPMKLVRDKLWIAQGFREHRKGPAGHRFQNTHPKELVADGGRCVFGSQAAYQAEIKR